MRVIRWLSVPVLLLALTALAVPAEATITCDDFCCISSCSRTCWTEDGPTTCGAYGSCFGSPDCTGFTASTATDRGEITSPLVCADSVTETPAATPAPAQPAD